MKNRNLVCAAVCSVLLVLLVIQSIWYHFVQNSEQLANAPPSNLGITRPLDPSEIPERFRERMLALKKLPLVYDKLSLELRRRASGANIADVDAYIEEILNFPWLKVDKLSLDIQKAKEILDQGHFGLDEAKDRILEYLAVLKRTSENGSTPVLCLIGPPGVGKTTLAESIAKATGRKFVRIPLGGLNDEVKIRGSMRVYAGAKSGAIVNAFKEANSMNPVILLDEIDRLSGKSSAGDPSSAILELIDPVLNKSFKDNYFELGIDMSKALIIATASSYKFSPILLERLEVIELSLYSVDEKVKISKFLLRKQLEEHHLKEGELIIDDAIMKKIIIEYTSEAGVRELDRTIARLARKALLETTTGHSKSLKVTADNLERLLGTPLVPPVLTFAADKIGAVHGLAWTDVGGTVSVFEAAVVPGTGNIKMTGNLGEISMESAETAFTVVKSSLAQYQMKPTFFLDKDVHVNAPFGGRKDGPSAGVAIATVIMSAVTGRPIDRNVAMTGEINLHGDVLPVGGIKDKLIAAHASGLKIALIPDANRSDLPDLPQELRKEMKIIPVESIEEVFKIALKPKPGLQHK